jgi:hypothetical protein
VRFLEDEFGEEGSIKESVFDEEIVKQSSLCTYHCSRIKQNLLILQEVNII